MTRMVKRTLPFIVGALLMTAFMASPSVAGDYGDASNGVIHVIDSVILPN